MANSHPRPLRKGALCSAFLSAAMVMSGCAHRPAQPDNPRPPAHSAYSLATGEEDSRTIRFSRIDSHGDPRIKRIIARLRQSSLGEEMYQYAVAKNLTFKWEFGNTERKGAYSFNKNRILAGAENTDDSVLSTLSHEIRHSWQDNTLRFPRWKLDPLGKWQARHFLEADGCAFNAHFIAEYKRETGYTIVSGNSFSRDVTNGYAKKDPQTRNYLKDALEPCFDLVVRHYHDDHLDILREDKEKYTAAFNRAVGPDRNRHAYRWHFNPATPAEKAALFAGFMNLSLDPKKAFPVTTSAADFLKWVQDQAAYKTPEGAAAVAAMQAEYNKMRENILIRINYR